MSASSLKMMCLSSGAIHAHAHSPRRCAVPSSSSPSSSSPSHSSSLRRRSGRRSCVITHARQMWYPGASAPDYLDGTMPGDFGFDPLRLGESGPINYYREAELMNGRWAMMAALGITFTEAAGLPAWFDAGASPQVRNIHVSLILQSPSLERRHCQNESTLPDYCLYIYNAFDITAVICGDDTLKNIVSIVVRGQLAILGWRTSAYYEHFGVQAFRRLQEQ